MHEMCHALSSRSRSLQVGLEAIDRLPRLSLI